MFTPPLKRISARDNPEFKRFLAVKSRKNRDLILVEGPKLLAEAIRSGASIDVVALREGSDVLPTTLPRDAPLVEFSSALIEALSDVETSQGILALVRRPTVDPAWLEDPKAFVLILDAVQDPGNVGTLFRTAEATGVTGILMTQGCADPLSSKALRASAGSAFRVPHLTGVSADELLALLPHGLPLVTTTVEPGAPSLFNTPLEFPLALALGSEGSGLDPRLDAQATQRIRVPQARPVESLNVASAGAVLLFDIARRAGILTN
ncbi:MAG: RNA methyltransferase [Vicinamibacteria bacterium]